MQRKSLLTFVTSQWQSATRYALLAALITLPPALRAGAITSVSATAQHRGVSPDTQSGDGVGFISKNAATSDGDANALATAKLGGLGVSASALSTMDNVFGINGVAEASSSALARFTVDDLIFSGPGSFVNVYMLFLIDGSVSVDGTAGAGANGIINFTNHSGSSVYGGFQGCVASGCGPFGTYLLDFSNTNHAIVRTPTFTVPTGQPINWLMQLSVSAGAGNINTGQQGSALASFENTFSIPTTGVVFGLPAGYTVNSAEAQILDNHWVGGNSSNVPEPSSETLFGIALVGMACLWHLRARGRTNRASTRC